MDRRDRAGALAAAAVLPGLALYVLARLPALPHAPDAEALHVVWVSRPLPDDAPQRMERTTRSTRAAGQAAVRRTVVAAADEVAHEATPAPSPSAPVPGAVRPDPHVLDLRVPDAAPVSFARNVLDRAPDAAEFDRPAALQVTLRDRSVGAALQRMTRASICRELRASLSPGNANAAAALRSLKQHGCGA